MSDEFLRSRRIRLLRWLLIKDGISEQAVDAVQEELRKEFSAIPDKGAKHRLLISERVGRYLAEKQLGEGADPQDLDKYAEHYKDIIVDLSTHLAYDIAKVTAIGGGAAIGTAIGIGLSSETKVPSAIAPLPVKKLLAEGQFRWPIDDPTATMQVLRDGSLLYVRRKLYVNAAANGEVRIVERQRTMFYMPFFFIILDHGNRFQTIYSGWGIPSVKRGGSIKAHQPIGTSAGWNVYFQMTRGGELVDPCLYLPPFPGGVRRKDIIPEETPFVWDLLDLSKQHYSRYASLTAISRRFLRRR
jgi:hypothetical protein